MSQDAIVVEDLTYRYGQLTAVDRISFKVAEGEILGFLGPNGAGKSTTVKVLTGQIRPQGGRALVLGLDIATDSKRVQSEIGVCFETTNLYEQMSAEENLRLFARLFGVKPFDSSALLQRVGLAGRESDRVERWWPGRWSTDHASSSWTSRQMGLIRHRQRLSGASYWKSGRGGPRSFSPRMT